MKKILISFLVAFSLIGCVDKTKISGRIADADGEVLYFEHMGLNTVAMLDSAILKSKGKFSFKVETPRYPDFYRLRIKDKSIVLALDSLSDKVRISASLKQMLNAAIEGADESESIAALRRSSHDIQILARQQKTEEVEAALEEHKKTVRNIILQNTHSAVAYYALNQTVNGYYFFSPSNKDDLPYWSAVATGYNTFYPEYERTLELKTTVLQAMRMKRAADFDIEKLIQTSRKEGLIEISLPDRLGETVRLSSLAGNVVLVDFSAYAMESATAHTLFLRELYDKYESYGLKIYQVSLDANKLMWLEQTRNIPWICVRDENAPNTLVLATYNVNELPTMFLMNGDGDIVGRFDHENIEAALRELL